MLKMKAENRIIISGAVLLIALFSYAIYFFEVVLSLEDLCNSDKSPEVYSQHTWDFSLYRNNDQKES